MIASSWQDFGEMAGGASAALTGLLFVSVSLNATRIAGHAGLRASARQTLVLVITPLIIAAILLTPGQADWVLGAELIVAGLLASWVLLGARRVKLGLADEDRRLVAVFDRRGPSIIIMLLVVTSGALVVAGQLAGLYLLFPATVIAFISGVLNAWIFLLPPPSSRPSRKPDSAEVPGKSH